MSVNEGVTTEMSDARGAVGLSLRSRVDRRCPHCDDVALVYDTDADAARCRSCGKLDRGTGRA